MSALAKTQKKKAEEIIAQAEATLNKKSAFSFFGGGNKERQTEDAAELYLQAANAYKVGGMSHEAGEIYVITGDLYRDKLSNGTEAAKCYSQAGQCFKKSNPTDAVSAFESAIALLTDGGRLTQAAKLCKECAEMYESDEIHIADGAEKSAIVLAIELYERAADLFELEDSKSQGSACQAKIAELCSAALDPPDLIRASQIYDQLGRKCLESNLLKFNAKGYFLQSTMCLLAAGDGIGAEQLLQRYEGIDYTFGDSREGKFARQLVECVEKYDAESFATACFEYDRISKLDPWKTSMLVKVKRSISDEAGGTGGEEDDFDLT